MLRAVPIGLLLQDFEAAENTEWSREALGDLQNHDQIRILKVSPPATCMLPPAGLSKLRVNERRAEVEREQHEHAVR